MFTYLFSFGLGPFGLVDDLASLPIKDDDFRAGDHKVGIHGQSQQLHSSSAMADVAGLVVSSTKGVTRPGSASCFAGFIFLLEGQPWVG